MAVPNDRRDAGKQGQFFRCALGIASGRNDASFGILAVGSANVGAGLAIRFGGNAAGVHNDDFGFSGY